MSDETKAKISKANSGEKNGMYGKVPVCPFKKGQTPWNKGIPYSTWIKGGKD